MYGSVAQEKIVALNKVVSHDAFRSLQITTRKLAALAVSRRNVPGVFAHAPQFIHVTQQ